MASGRASAKAAPCTHGSGLQGKTTVGVNRGGNVDGEQAHQPREHPQAVGVCLPALHQRGGGEAVELQLVRSERGGQ